MAQYIFKIMKWYSLLILVLICTSCRDFIEKDISEDMIEVYTPYNGDTVTSGDIQFMWKELDGANQYNIQIVKPNFGQIETFLVDSNVNGTSVSFQLDKGNYEWRIQGVNNGYKTEYLVHTLYVDSSSNLNNFSINIIAPQNNFYSNTTTIQANWNQVSIADNYNVILKSGSDWTSGTTNESDNTTNTNYTFSTLLSEQTYILGVRAENNYPSYTDYETRVINIDQTSPGQPTITTPTYESFFNTNNTVSFDWTRANDIGIIQSPQYDSIYIYTDSLQTLFLREQLTPTDFQTTFPNTGDYFWRIKTFDEAGNESTYSTTGKIIIQ